MIGRTFSHYRILAPLGSGGMGVVYRAEDVRLGREVALKFVSDDLANDAQAVQRLRSEARAASALNHSSICTIYDIGEDDGHPFIVMELMKGETLRDRLGKGSMRVHQLLDIGIEVADALQTAHSAGIIHRDIKPGNIFLTERGGVKILDFGLAKLTPRFKGLSTTVQTLDVTSAGVTLGTISYMSPEQATAEELDGRTDLFSLGVVLYESASGRHPFAGKTTAVTLAAILDKPPAPLDGELPQRLHDIIHNCLEKDRELRYQSAADLRADLKRLRRDIESGHSRAVDVESASAVARQSEARSRRSQLAVPAAGEVTVATGRVSPPPSGAAPVSTSSASTVMPLSRSYAWPAAVAIVLVTAIAGYLVWSRPASEPLSPVATTPSTTTPAVEPAPVTPPTLPTPALSQADAENRLVLARASLSGHNPRAALAYALEVLAVYPQHAAALAVRADATAAIDTFDAALDDARRRLTARDIEGAARALERARAVDPTSPAMIELSARLAAAVPTRAAAPLVPPPARDAAPRSEPIVRAEPPRQEAARPEPPRSEVSAAAVTPSPLPSPSPPPAPLPAPVAAPPVVTVPPAVIPEPPAPRSLPVERKDPPVDSDDTLIRRVAATYARAIETKDLSLFRSIKPNLSREEERRLQDGFRAVASQRVALTVLSIERQGDAATVVVRRTDTIDAGGRQQTRDSQQTLRMQRTGSSWVVTEIR